MTDAISGDYSSTYQTSSTTSSNSSSTVDKDEFLKLLTYQLKAQNPLKPYDNQEFAAQLAQFSQLEQLTDIRSLLEEQVQTNLILTQTISNTALPGLLGKSAKALSDTVKFDGQNNVDLGYNLPYQAASGTLKIKDEDGATVRTIKLGSSGLEAGDHDYTWDGTDDDGNTVEEGNYTISVDLKDESGGSFTADTYTYGKIEAVRFKSEGTLLVINGQEIALQDVADVTT